MISAVTGQAPAFDPKVFAGQGNYPAQAIVEPNLSQRLIEAEGYLDDVFVMLDHLQGMDKKPESNMQSTVSTGSIEVASRVCEKAAILSSRIKTIAGQIGTL